MANSELVSIVVRTRDRPEMLARALDSITCQDHQNFEVLIVNDAGADVASIISAYDSRILSLRYYYLDTNIGRAAALNHGIDHAQGNYLVFLDDDDWWESDHIANLVSAMNEEGVLVAYSGTRAVKAKGNGFEEVRVFNESFDRNRLFYQNYIPINSIIIAREIFERGCRFDGGLEVFEDWDFWIVLLGQTITFTHVPKITANYRIHDGQTFGLNGSDETIMRLIHCRGAKLWGDDEIDDLLTRLSLLSAAELSRKE